MKNATLNHQLANSLFKVKLADSRERQLEEFRQKDQEFSEKGLYRQSYGYQEVIKLFKKQIKENCEILLVCLIESIEKQKPVGDDFKRVIYLRIASFIETEISLKQTKLRQKLTANRFSKGATSSFFRDFNYEIVRLKDYFKDKIIVEVEAEALRCSQSEEHSEAVVSNDGQAVEDIVDIKPNIFGIGLNINALWRRFKKRFF